VRRGMRRYQESEERNGETPCKGGGGG